MIRLQSLLGPIYLMMLIYIIDTRTLQFEELENLTPSQRNTLAQFRLTVERMLTHDYMKEDLYLTRFLKTKNFRLQDAVKAIKEAMEWRTINAMDTIDTEDFSDLEPDFPLYFDGVDKQGRVVMEAHFGDWPMRTAVVAGKLPRLKRYGVKAIDDATKKVREVRAASGKNVTQWVMLLNMEGFNVIENACPACFPYYLNFVTSYEKYYPFTVGGMYFVNTPEAFDIILNLVRPLMSSQTRQVMKVFGTDSRKWQPFLDKRFEKSEISEWFGGYKVRRGKY